jgi:phage portal protein BeeE
VLRQSYIAKYGGGRNARVPLILTGGLEVEKLSITPVDAALIPTRQFTVEEICRVFGVPPFMVGATDKTTSWGSGIEQQGIALREVHAAPAPHARSSRSSTASSGRTARSTSSNTTPRRSSAATSRRAWRAIASAVGRAGERGWMEPNEVRHLELMEPIDGGETFNWRPECEKTS